MKFTRDRVLQTVATGVNSTTTTVLWPEIEDLVFSLATAADGSAVALPVAFNPESTFTIPLNGTSIIYVTVDVEALGAAALTGIDVLMEWQHPDNVDLWIPTLVGVAGVAAPAAHIQACVGVQTFIVTSREELIASHYARVRFRRTAGVPDADTVIRCYWHTNAFRPEGLVG